jgi:prevent-host-death family protein
MDHQLVHNFTMKISVTEAKAQLTDLVRRAEAGEEVVLTRHGLEVVRLAPMKRRPTPEQKAALLEQVRASARQSASPGPAAARSQDFLYDEFGLPK